MISNKNNCILLVLMVLFVCLGCTNANSDSNTSATIPNQNTKEANFHDLNNLSGTQFSKWIPVEYKHISFKLPPTLEKSSKEHIFEMNISTESDALKDMYQQLGLNEAIKSHPETANEHFARVILECFIYPEAEGVNFGDTIGWTKADLNSFF